MLNLLIGVILLCVTFGITISKIKTDYGVCKHRQHVKPLIIDREVL